MRKARCGKCGEVTEVKRYNEYEYNIFQLNCSNCRHPILDGEPVDIERYLLFDKNVREFIDSFLYRSEILLQLSDKEIFELLGIPSLCITKQKGINDAYSQKHRYASLKLLEFFNFNPAEVGIFIRRYVKITKGNYNEELKSLKKKQKKSIEEKAGFSLLSYFAGKLTFPGIGLLFKLADQHDKEKRKQYLQGKTISAPSNIYTEKGMYTEIIDTWKKSNQNYERIHFKITSDNFYK